MIRGPSKQALQKFQVDIWMNTHDEHRPTDETVSKQIDKLDAICNSLNDLVLDNTEAREIVERVKGDVHALITDEEKKILVQSVENPIGDIIEYDALSHFSKHEALQALSVLLLDKDGDIYRASPLHVVSLLATLFEVGFVTGAKYVRELNGST